MGLVNFSSKSLGNFALFFIVLLSIEAASALDCSSVVVKEQEGVLNWLGNVTFTVPESTTEETGWAVTIQFDQKFTGVGVWDGWGESHPEEAWARITNRDHNAVLVKGEKFSFRFRVNYFTDVTQPKVISLKFFDIDLCR